MSYKKGALLYEGKGKKVFSVEKMDSKLWIEFKDSLTAFNAQKKGSFQNKGAVNRDIASVIFKYLKSKKIGSHWVEDQGTTEWICEKLKMIPLEVVVRNVMAGSLAKKFNMQEGAEIKPPLVEFYYKKDEWNDPFISDDHALYLKAVQSAKDLAILKKAALDINKNLKVLFLKLGIRLVDFKLEFGKNAKGKIVLGDEITPDSCRLWDIKTGKKLDKDVFRRDLGDVSEGYFEVYNRMKKTIKKNI
jgi:phosphoribosylaminoimidazole-succinocarboxamide synthase